jgi:hypothetical protein
MRNPRTSFIGTVAPGCAFAQPGLRTADEPEAAGTLTGNVAFGRLLEARLAA